MEKSAERLALSALVLAALALYFAGLLVDALTTENTRLWLELQKTKPAPKPGDDALVIEGRVRGE